MCSLSFSKIATLAIALFPTLGITAPAPITAFKRQSLHFNFQDDKVRGVNLGGWFVLEPWITPSLFEACPDSVVDEWTMSAYYGPTQMESLMQQHWSTWITEDDFAQIAAAGLNFVRIPIGYWSIAPVAGDPYVQGAYAYLNSALGWAANNGISVLIDLHGAPGSQNGFDNSGRRGPIDWLQGDTLQQTHAALTQIQNDHASNPVVASIELVNEPIAGVLGFDNVENFYTQGHQNLQGTELVTTIHDAFEGPQAWLSWASSRSNVMIDTHYYQVFNTTELAYTPAEHISAACQEGQSILSNIWTIVGEFTGAMTDCALWLNGRGIGARYDGSYDGSTAIGSCDGLTNNTVDGLSQEYLQAIGQFTQAQMSAFEQDEGWIFWTWTTESAPEWDYKALYGAGIIPNASDIDTSLCWSA